MKAQWFHNPRHYEFAKALMDDSYSSNRYDVFRDFLEVAFITFSQAVYKLRTGTIDAKREERYLQIMRSHKGYAKTFPRALGILVDGLERQEHDFLGDVFGAIGANDKTYKGQCFTPYSLCKAMAEMTFGDITKESWVKEGRGRLTFSEPACGGGAMVLACHRALLDRGFTPYDYHATAVDVDSKCYHMTYIQLTLCGVPAHVVHGNTLSLEEWDAMPTLVSAMTYFGTDIPGMTGTANAPGAAGSVTVPSQHDLPVVKIRKRGAA